jgi:hypothetical protein
MVKDRMSPIERASTCSVLCVATAFFLGCSDSDAISSYLAPVSNAGDAHSSPAGKQALLGAIVPHGEQCWFFKMVGPPELMEAEQERFHAFIRSIRFSEDDKATPTWTLPAGWAQTAGSGMRYATLRFGTAASAGELTVIGLPTADSSDEDYVLSNVNRWREQLQLPPIDAAALASQATVIRLEGGNATIVQMHGHGGGTGSERTSPRMADAMHAHPPLPAHAESTSHSRPSQLKFTVPDGWKQEAASGMRNAAFTVREGDQTVEITVIALSAEAGELLPNVNRWREQLLLPQTSSGDLAASTQKIGIGPAVGDFVAVAGPSDATRPQTILAAMTLYGGRSWFIKLMGDSDLAAREEDRFKSFVRSVEF